jgi:hypothetical protein
MRPNGIPRRVASRAASRSVCSRFALGTAWPRIAIGITPRKRICTSKRSGSAKARGAARYEYGLRNE